MSERALDLLKTAQREQRSCRCEELSTDDLITVQLALGVYISSVKESGVDPRFTDYGRASELEKKVTAELNLRLNGALR